MTRDQVNIIASQGTFHHRRLHGKVIETHISWVVLSGNNAFKIKKPLKLGFLDFSTIALRKKLCYREVTLNRRLTDIYLGVVPVRLHGERYLIGGAKGKIVDFAVHMKRLPQSRQMDNMIRRGTLVAQHVRAVGTLLASFHTEAPVIRSPFVLSAERELFNNISILRPLVRMEFGNKYSAMIDRAIRWSDAFLSRHKKRLKDRIAEGFKRDVPATSTAEIFLFIGGLSFLIASSSTTSSGKSMYFMSLHSF